MQEGGHLPDAREHSLSCKATNVRHSGRLKHFHVTFPNFRVLYLEPKSSRSKAEQVISGFLKTSRRLGKTRGAAETNMHCRPELTEILLEKRMRKWLGILYCGSRNRRSARARRNLVRLAVRHEAIARKIGLTLPGNYSL